MFYGYGRGFGFRGSAPAWPYIGGGRGGLPRCGYPAARFGVAPPIYTAPPDYWSGAPAGTTMSNLQATATRLQQQLADIERQIQELENNS